jgi:hypothetical protein
MQKHFGRGRLPAERDWPSFRSRPSSINPQDNSERRQFDATRVYATLKLLPHNDLWQSVGRPLSASSHRGADCAVGLVIDMHMPLMMIGWKSAR